MSSKSKLDVRALWEALDQQRWERRLSWRQVASETGVLSSTFSRMAVGHSIGINNYVALVDWLGVSADLFLRRDESVYERISKPRSREALDAITQALALLRQDDPKKNEVRRIDGLLRAALSDVDRFWVRWSAFTPKYEGGNYG